MNEEENRDILLSTKKQKNVHQIRAELKTGDSSANMFQQQQKKKKEQSNYNLSRLKQSDLFPGLKFGITQSNNKHALFY